MNDTSLGYDRLHAEIVVQAELLRHGLDGADLSVPVPSCPGWNLAQLLRHLGGGYRWAETIVRTRAIEPPSDREVRDVSADTSEGPAALGARLTEGAGRLADALRAAGPEARVWTPIPGPRTPASLARRFAYETLMHRADAVLALGAEFTVEHDVARDALAEWMELGALPQMFDFHPRMRELLGPGRTLHLHATDADAEWVVDLTGDAIVHRRAHEKAAVAVRAPLTDLLLLVYRRRPARGENIEISGDTALLDFWLDRVGFG